MISPLRFCSPHTHISPFRFFFPLSPTFFWVKTPTFQKKNPRFRFAIVVGISVSTQKKKYLNEEDATTQMPWRSSRCTLTFTLSLDINIRSNRLAGWGTLNLTINAEENGRLRNALGAAIHSPLSKLPRNVPKARNLQSWFRLPVANLVAVVKGAGKKIGGNFNTIVISTIRDNNGRRRLSRKRLLLVFYLLRRVIILSERKRRR